MPDERPASGVKIDKPFWMGRCEVTNEQFALFDPTHDSRWENGDFIKFGLGERGWTLARPQQPVVRVSWTQAMAFCRWLSQQDRPDVHAADRGPVGIRLPRRHRDAALVRDRGRRFLGRGQRLRPQPSDHRHVRRSEPSEHDSPVASGRHAIRRSQPRLGAGRQLSAESLGPVRHARQRRRMDPLGVPALSLPRRRPQRPAPSGKRVVRGGSWYDRPDRCRSAFRQAYPADQPVYDVGFRVVCE